MNQWMKNRILCNFQQKQWMKISIEKGYNTVKNEYIKIISEEKNNSFLDGLRIVGASKIYNLSHGKKLSALENIYF